MYYECTNNNNMVCAHAVVRVEITTEERLEHEIIAHRRKIGLKIGDCYANRGRCADAQ